MQKVIEIVNLLFHDIAGKVPSHQIVLDWVVKAGLATSKEDYDGKSLGEINSMLDGKYHLIMDNSISNNNQEIHLQLASPAQHLGDTLKHSNVHVANMSVGMNWTGDMVKEQLEKTMADMAGTLDYVTSDNGSILSKACVTLGIKQHKDISHTLGMYLQQVYEKDVDYKRFNERMSFARKFCHTDIGHLLPPAQRSIARFMNEFARVDWAYAIRENFMMLSSKARFVFGFVNELGSFIDEMKEVMGCFRQVEALCKKEGLSHKTAKECRRIVNERLVMGNERQQQIGNLMLQYFNREEALLDSENAVHNISSDIIESSFGYIKFRISPNKNNGFTPLILLLPLHLKVADIDNCADFNVKTLMEQTRYEDIKKYRKEKLMPNPADDRQNIFSMAVGF